MDLCQIMVSAKTVSTKNQIQIILKDSNLVQNKIIFLSLQSNSNTMNQQKVVFKVFIFERYSETSKSGNPQKN